MTQDIVERFGALIAEEADEYEADAADAFERGERPDLWEREVTVPVAWLSEATALITTLTAERDALKDEVEQIRGEASGAHEADSRAFLSANARAETAEALVQSMRETVEQAFKDGLAYGNNVADADPDVAWQQSRVRAAISRSEV